LTELFKMKGVTFLGSRLFEHPYLRDVFSIWHITKRTV